ncbi:hypothetical protein K3495_g5198 [Podosphaera aphanis]|nr:hypothetical protein K3495_g5198 [Podosphaera aphanis]
MTGWDPLRPVAGHKRVHSPERETMTTRRSRQVVKHDYKRLPYSKSAQIPPDPKTWNEAMSCSEATQWKKVADEEFCSLKDKRAIKLNQRTQLPQGRKSMKCKWVLKNDFRADGSIGKWKARCTAKGFAQRQRIDYQETFAPTPRPETGRIMLVLTHQFGWHRRQGDVPTAFLNPDLHIYLYMKMP